MQNNLPGFGGNLSTSQNQFVPAGFAIHLRKCMVERIARQGDSWVVKPETGDRVLGTHPTKKAALKQLAAIEIAKHKK